MKKISFFLVLLPLMLAACDSLPDWLGAKEKDKLPGERFSVMPEMVELTPNADIASDTVDVPDAVRTSSSGLSSGNFYTEGDLTSVQTQSIGDEPQDEFLLDFPPVVTDNAIYTID